MLFVVVIVVGFRHTFTCTAVATYAFIFDLTPICQRLFLPDVPRCTHGGLPITASRASLTILQRNLQSEEAAIDSHVFSALAIGGGGSLRRSKKCPLSHPHVGCTAPHRAEPSGPCLWTRRFPSRWIDYVDY